MEGHYAIPLITLTPGGGNEVLLYGMTVFRYYPVLHRT